MCPHTLTKTPGRASKNQFISTSISEFKPRPSETPAARQQSSRDARVDMLISKDVRLPFGHTTGSAPAGSYAAVLGAEHVRGWYMKGPSDRAVVSAAHEAYP